jgi:hypothetical protein
MIDARAEGLDRALRWGMPLAGLSCFVMVASGWLVFPRTAQAPTSWLALAADLLILCAYAALGWFGASATVRRDPRILPTAVCFGALAGAVFCVEMILEYALVPTNKTSLVLVEFGALIFLFFMVGLEVGRTTGKLGAGILAAVWGATIASLLWLGSFLVITYLFHGTGRQGRVFQAEGIYEDFRRSGEGDFDTWIMQDSMGAAFFHLLLGPMVAAFLGLMGAILAKLVTRGRARSG